MDHIQDLRRDTKVTKNPSRSKSAGWDGWIRTSDMTESKSVALPLGDTPMCRLSLSPEKERRAGVNHSGESFTPRLSVGWYIGVEPMTSRATIWRANQLRQYHHVLARQEGLEPPTYCLEGSCSIQLSYWRIFSWQLPHETIRGAGDGNRTHATSLEGWGSTIELHPRNSERLTLYTFSHALSSDFFKFFKFRQKRQKSLPPPRISCAISQKMRRRQSFSFFYFSELRFTITKQEV